MSTDHNRIKVADLEKNQQDKILVTDANGELEFQDIKNIKSENYNALDYTTEGKALDARQGKVLKDLIDTKSEDKSNKTDDIEANKTSSVKYTSAKSVVDWFKSFLFPNVSSKTTAFSDTDLILTGDSEDSFKTKTGTFAQLKANLKSYFDTIFQSVLVSGSNIKTINGTSLLGSGNITIPDVSTITAQTLYIHSVSGNDSTAIIGNPSKPFQTTAGAIAALPPNNGETYKFLYQNNVVHNVTVQIPFRNLIFEGNTYGNSSTGILQGSSIVDLNFTSLGGTYTNIIDTSVPNGNKFDIRIVFSKLKISSTYTGNLRIGDQASLIIADEIGVDFRSSNSVFNIASVVGVIDKLYWSGTGTSLGAIFTGVGLERAWTNNLEIREFIISNNNNVYLIGELYSFYNVRIGKITGTTTGIVFLTYGTTYGTGSAKLTIGNITLNGKVYLSNQSSSNDIFHFENTSLSANTQLNTGESQGIITGNLSIRNTVGLSAIYERNGSILQFINFKGKINILNKHVANSVFIFKDSSFDLTTNLFDIPQNIPNNNSIIFIGVNVFKQSTTGALIKNTISANFSIEKQGINAITTNATSLASSGTVTVDNTTPFNY